MFIFILGELKKKNPSILKIQVYLYFSHSVKVRKEELENLIVQLKDKKKNSFEFRETVFHFMEPKVPTSQALKLL